MRLDGKVALVTGGARGVGFAVATALARQGAVIAIADIDAQGANAAAAALRETGERAHGFVVDVRDARSVPTLLKDIAAQLGRVDIVINSVSGSGVARELICMAESCRVQGRTLDVDGVDLVEENQ